MIYFLVLLFFFTLLFLGMPVSILLGIIGTTFLFLQLGLDTTIPQLALVSYRSVNDFILVAIPLFILTGNIMLTGGIGSKLFRLADSWLRHLPGGVGIATVASCAFFGAISGSSTATAVTIGSVALPEMTKRNYPKKFAMAILAAGGTLGILIPPSLALILYGAITEQPVDRLFIAGFIPGILLSLGFMLFVALYSRKKLPRQEKAEWNERWISLKEAFWGLLMPIIILGGIYTGAFTPTEAAGVSAFYALVVCFFIYKSLDLKKFYQILKDTAVTTGMILFIVVGAMILGYGLTNNRLPQQLAEFITGLDASPLMVLLMVNLLWLVLGFFLEVVSIVLITLPIVFPVLMSMGFDPIWLAIIMIINMEMALITPPIGVNLFALQSIDKGKERLHVFQLGKAVLPFIIIMATLMLLLVIFPQLALWLAYRI
jgi:C4-dicarboxylate transporter DctM subunit